MTGLFNKNTIKKETAPAFTTEYLILLSADGNAVEYRIPARCETIWDEEGAVLKAMKAAEKEHDQVEFYLSVNSRAYENLSDDEMKIFVRDLWNFYASKIHELNQMIFNLDMIDHQTETEAKEYDKYVSQRRQLKREIYNYNK